MDLITIAGDLSASVGKLKFGPPVFHVYNPLNYAWQSHRTYLERYGGGGREIVLVGMNPGPWGMVQTGVPFGDVVMVRDWLGIHAQIKRPAKEHPARPIQGFDCRRREVSGKRLWGWARATYGTPERFFDRFFVFNYCPLAFMEESGRNLTPDRLPAEMREPLLERCDASLKKVVERLEPRYVLGVGRFAERRVNAALADMDLTTGMVPHPSPANPAANQGWGEAMNRALAAAGIQLP
ncbi:uracil-DNA glycosylase family protein [Methylohalobius crimeensis]|uniref:uracil-DNA glycosylase family protein n=1 Tax=Methylohalobius crimeensis TaxID=244365 RepID=UPI0003B3AFD4|nr:uracil-DNA glycosylase family protein [Methylohalobius crimeensis]